MNIYTYMGIGLLVVGGIVLAVTGLIGGWKQLKQGTAFVPNYGKPMHPTVKKLMGTGIVLLILGCIGMGIGLQISLN